MVMSAQNFFPIVFKNIGASPSTLTSKFRNIALLTHFLRQRFFLSSGVHSKIFFSHLSSLVTWPTYLIFNFFAQHFLTCKYNLLSDLQSNHQFSKFLNTKIQTFQQPTKWHPISDVPQHEIPINSQPNLHFWYSWTRKYKLHTNSQSNHQFLKFWNIERISFPLTQKSTPNLWRSST